MDAGKRRRREFAAVAFGIALTAAAYLWTLLSVSPGVASREPLGQYPLLTEALLSGQLHFKVSPDPRLLKLADPYAGYQGIPRIHDASLYHGRYYTYFGVTPVVILMAPWRLLTGTFLREGAATVIFAFAGFLISAGLWVAGQRRFFPKLPATWLGFGVLMLGLGNYVFVLIQTPEVYEVPISCAYACLMAALAFVAVAAAADRPARRNVGLALASLAWGLSVGARPDYLLSLPAFALPVAVLWWREGRRQGFGSRRSWGLLASAGAPLALVGAALAAYNWARFGNLFETGNTYQLAAVDERGVRLISLAYFHNGLRAYMAPAPIYSPYFPFLTPSHWSYGLPFWAPFAFAALGFPLTLRDPALRRDPAWVSTGGASLLAALLNFGTLCSFWGGGVGRYEINFIPAAVGTGLFVASKVRAAARGPGMRVLGAVLAAAAAFTLAHSVLLGLSGRADDLRPLARLLDRPAGAVERLFRVSEGSVEMNVLLPKPFPAPGEPLVATGGGRDVVTLRHPDPGHVQFAFFHRGSGGPSSRLLPVDPGRLHAIAIDLGSLYPPPEHPDFAGWPREKVDALRRRVRVRLDGRTVLQASATFYPNDPFHTTIGRYPSDDDVSRPLFTGRILSLRRGGIPRPSEVTPVWSGGPVRLTVRFPAFRAAYGEPLVSTGPWREGDLAYVTYLGPGRVRFGHDSAAYGAVETAVVTYDPSAPHTVDIDMGSLHPNLAAIPAAAVRFQLRFDGGLLISVPRPFHAAPFIDTAFGFNAAGSSAAAATFSGPELDIAALGPFQGPPPIDDARGPVRLLVRFPAGRTGSREPLLVTGRTGAGDAIYADYVDPSHVRIGHDHWSVGGPLGAPVAVDPFEPHEVIVRMTPHPEVTIDGRAALDSPLPPYPATAAQIFPGANPIGASTCGPRFSGEILVAEPAPTPEVTRPAPPASPRPVSGR